MRTSNHSFTPATRVIGEAGAGMEGNTVRRAPSPRRLRGFTLVELMVTLTLVGVLMMVAVPSFQAFKRRSELSAATNSFVAMLGTVRSEAMKRGRSAVVVPSDGSNWSNGWTAFVDKSVPRDDAYDAATDELITKSGEPLATFLSMANDDTSTFFKFNGAGYTMTSTGLGATTIEITRNDVTGGELLTYTRRIKIGSTGRIRVCTPQSATDTRCAATGF